VFLASTINAAEASGKIIKGIAQAKTTNTAGIKTAQSTSGSVVLMLRWSLIGYYFFVIFNFQGYHKAMMNA
jgi:hypothetical protein